MPRSYPHSHVAHGRHVGFSLKHRGNDPCYYAYFRGLDGRRLERDTQQTAFERARKAAHAIIEKEFAPVPRQAHSRVVGRSSTAFEREGGREWAAAPNHRILREAHPPNPPPL